MNLGAYSIASSLTDEIAKTIRERILKGEYGIGERIKENQLATELKVSRTPVREAIKQLESEGLVETIPNRGTFAAGFSKQDVEDIYAVRTVVEVMAVKWAVNRISDEELLKIQEAFDMMEFFTAKRDCAKVMELNTRFHKTIYDASRSRFLVRILKSYQEYVQQTRKVTVYCEDNLQPILEEHREILQAIKNRDENEAVEKIFVHLANSQGRAEVAMKLNRSDLLPKIIADQVG